MRHAGERRRALRALRLQLLGRAPSRRLRPSALLLRFLPLLDLRFSGLNMRTALAVLLVAGLLAGPCAGEQRAIDDNYAPDASRRYLHAEAAFAACSSSSVGGGGAVDAGVMAGITLHLPS